jgi:hypothetical protein
MVFREAAHVIFSHLKIHEEESLTRKALLRFIRIARHYRTSVILDAQRFVDIYKGVRDCIDRIAIKKTSQHGLPEEIRWIYKEIEEIRKKWYPKIKGTPREKKMNERLPSIDHLYPNEYYAVYDSQYYKKENRMPRFHHREPKDDFYELSGISVKRIGTAAQFRTEEDDSITNKGSESDNWRDLSIKLARKHSEHNFYRKDEDGKYRKVTKDWISREMFGYADNTGLIQLRKRKLSTEKYKQKESTEDIQKNENDEHIV